MGRFVAGGEWNGREGKEDYGRGKRGRGEKEIMEKGGKRGGNGENSALVVGGIDAPEKMAVKT